MDATDKTRGRRLLLLSYHYPPGTAAGALRWEKLTILAAERGWSVDAVTAEPTVIDDRRTEVLPDATRIFRTGANAKPWIATIASALARSGRPLRSISSPADDAGNPQRTAVARAERLLRSDSLTWGISTADVRRMVASLADIEREWIWARAAARKARSLASANSYDAIVTCGPPHMVHEAGRRLSSRYDLPLILDHRDAWSVTPVVHEDFASPLWLKVAGFYERRATRQASLVVANTPALAQVIQSRFPEKADSVISVMNGYDDDVIPDLPSRSRFLILYAGTVYMDRNPDRFFQALARFMSNRSLNTEDVAVHFVGNLDAAADMICRSADAHGVGGSVRVLQKVSRGELLAMMAEASVLLSLAQDVDLAVPSKVFEYMRFPAHILALAKSDTATADVLQRAGGRAVAPDDVAGIHRVIKTAYDTYLKGRRPEPLAKDPTLSRRHQAGVLFDAIDRLVDQRVSSIRPDLTGR